jgi:hypothetical protein
VRKVSPKENFDPSKEKHVGNKKLNLISIDLGDVKTFQEDLFSSKGKPLVVFTLCLIVFRHK